MISSPFDHLLYLYRMYRVLLSVILSHLQTAPEGRGRKEGHTKICILIVHVPVFNRTPCSV